MSEFLERVFFIGYYNNWNGFNKNASFFFVSKETAYRIIGFLLKTPARPKKEVKFNTFKKIYIWQSLMFITWIKNLKEKWKVKICSLWISYTHFSRSAKHIFFLRFNQKHFSHLVKHIFHVLVIHIKFRYTHFWSYTHFSCTHFSRSSTT